MNKLLLHIFIAFHGLIMLGANDQLVCAQSSNVFTDPRDEQVYRTLSFKNALKDANTTWLAQNLNYKMPGSYAYDNDESYRKTMGLLYNSEAAKKACPNGWHLATDTDWTILINNFGGSGKAGVALKSSKWWGDKDNGTNSSGFSAVPGGVRNEDGSYTGLGQVGFWWTSAPSRDGIAMNFVVIWENSNVGRGKIHAFEGYSIRCVMD